MKCEDCGNDKGEEEVCPYAQDVYNEIDNVIICNDCYDERCQNI